MSSVRQGAERGNVSQDVRASGVCIRSVIKARCSHCMRSRRAHALAPSEKCGQKKVFNPAYWNRNKSAPGALLFAAMLGLSSKKGQWEREIWGKYCWVDGSGDRAARRVPP